MFPRAILHAPVLLAAALLTSCDDPTWPLPREDAPQVLDVPSEFSAFEDAIEALAGSPLYPVPNTR